MATVANTVHKPPRLIGEPTTVEMDVESASVIKAGDFVCCKDSSTNDMYAVVPSAIADGGTDTQNREAAADLFVGVAINGSASGDTDKIRVAVYPSRLWLKQQTAAAIYVNDAVEIYSDADPLLTPNDSVVAGTTSQVAVCISSKPSTTDKWFKAQLLPSAVYAHLTAQS